MNNKDKPNTFPWPPVLLLTALALAWVMNMFFPLPLPIDGLGSWILSALGALLIIAALGVDVWCWRVMEHHNTTILPHKGANHLVTQGPFSYSRNPIYVGNIALLFGCGLLFGNAWYFLASILMIYLLRHFAVLREEAHLLEKFGQEWKAYCIKTRRWI